MITPSHFRPNLPAAAPVHLSIHGLVQGVGFRDALSLQALQRGLHGWVRNRRDGSVEALVIGDDDHVAAIIEACREGPFGARITDIEITDADDDSSVGFTPKPTL